MDSGKITKIKKYLFLISVLFLMISIIHLTYVYIYNDAKFKPISWGIISEWLIWPPPNINPLKLQTGNNKYIISFLYRSLQSYNIKNKDISNDIASCDTSNLLYIECYLENNLKWSNWDKITTSDIVSTYKILKNTDVNPLIQSLLSDTQIIEKDNIIIFKNSKKDINFLNVLFTPIVNKSILDNIGEEELYWNFPIIWWIYSWKYSLENIIPNNTLGIIEAILVKNKNYYQNKVYIEKIILKFFKDTSSFLKHKDSINIFNDKNNILWNSIPRLESNNYTLPQYVSIIINKDKIQDKNLRNFLLNSINRENLLKIIWKNYFKPIYNPYLNNIKIDKEPENKNISELFSKLWYYKKSELLKKVLENSWKKLYSQEVKINKKDTKAFSWKLQKNEIQSELSWKDKGESPSVKKLMSTFSWAIKPITKEMILKDFWWKSKTIISPNFIDKYNFITKDNILLKWKVNKNIDNVYINDDKIWYNTKKKEFYYTLKKSEKNISIWVNSYKIYFEVDNNKNFQEEIFFIYNPNKWKLEREKDLFIDSIIKKDKEKIKQIDEIKKNKAIKTKEIDKNKFNKINSLDDNLFYDNNLNPLSLNLLYINSEQNIITTANYIKSSLSQQWVQVNISPISIFELYNWLKVKNNNDTGSTINKKTKLDYDMILIWINSWFFNFNLFPYFHSSQVKDWYNMSKLKKLNLDILLEELKWNNLAKDKVFELEKKVLDILKNEQLIKTLYTPFINNLVDKNIKNYFLPKELPSKSLRVESIYNSYILEQKFINLDNKSIINFIKFLYKKVNEY